MFRHLEKRIGSNEELVMREYDMLANAGQTEAARDLLNDAIKKASGTKLILRHASRGVYRASVTLHEGPRAVRKGVGLDPDDSMTRIALAQFYCNSGRADEGFKNLKEAFGDPPVWTSIRKCNCCSASSKRADTPKPRFPPIRNNKATPDRRTERRIRRAVNRTASKVTSCTRAGKFTEARDAFAKAVTL
ncbi:MAG: hypothetical protein IPP33_16635 [Flavobacteriales bacterium]|nr:hypothetical protein [Flavobacteriales bacterium]